MDDDGLDKRFWWKMAGTWLLLAVLCIIGLLIFSRWTLRFGLIGAFAILIVLLGFLAWRHDRKEKARYDDETA
jgi:lipopolysaccharide export LptBFGC system permease protein LptF